MLKRSASLAPIRHGIGMSLGPGSNNTDLIECRPRHAQFAIELHENDHCCNRPPIAM